MERSEDSSLSVIKVIQEAEVEHPVHAGVAEKP